MKQVKHVSVYLTDTEDH